MLISFFLSDLLMCMMFLYLQFDFEILWTATNNNNTIIFYLIDDDGGDRVTALALCFRARITNHSCYQWYKSCKTTKKFSETRRQLEMCASFF